MKYLLLVVLILLVGCSEYFPIDAKIEEMNQLSCKPVGSSMCAGWKE